MQAQHANLNEDIVLNWFYKILKKFLSIHRGKEIKNLLPGSVLVIVEVFI